MSRAQIAWLVAPLWVPVFLGSYAAFETFPDSTQYWWVAFVAIISALFAYLGMFAIGYPAFRFLETRNMTSLWVAAAVGFAAAILTSMIVLVCLVLALGGDLREIALLFHQDTTVPFAIFLGLLGTLVGATFWLIARPDRQTP